MLGAKRTQRFRRWAMRVVWVRFSTKKLLWSAWVIRNVIARATSRVGQRTSIAAKAGKARWKNEYGGKKEEVNGSDHARSWLYTGGLPTRQIQVSTVPRTSWYIKVSTALARKLGHSPSSSLLMACGGYAVRRHCIEYVQVMGFGLYLDYPRTLEYRLSLHLVAVNR